VLDSRFENLPFGAGFVDGKPLVGSGTIVAGVVIALLYATNLVYCQRSALQLLDAAALSSDMHANLVWAKSIEEQGWLNPRPYHPWADWMQNIAPYSQWVSWWGGEKIFQQSPLYAYLLSLFMHRYFAMRVLQALMSIAMCVFIGLFAARIAGRTAGWIAFWLAALYAPFYLYSWPFLRDGLSWFLTAAMVWVLTELTQEDWKEPRARHLAWLAGLLLGFGFLSKETYLLLIPAVWMVLCFLSWKLERRWGIALRVAAGTILAIFPLLIRNVVVGAPILSSSNRFAESFILGNSEGASPYLLIIPERTGEILRETHGHALPVVRETLKSHPDGLLGLTRLQIRKLLSLFDPYESPDNLSFYFVEHVSPVVRFGLRYWMLLPPGLAGLCLGLWRRDRRLLWIWVTLPVFVLSLLMGIPVSRYRQVLMLFLIPCAAYFLAFLADLLRQKRLRSFGYSLLALVGGWIAVLGPLARQPREQYERVSEYLVCAQIYHQLGDRVREQEMLEVVRQRFPEFAPVQRSLGEQLP
jgi:4-amino-4-deoxy-L-arabinose transferase-like glycosyltransferase